MPKYRVTDPQSGKTLTLTGDSPPTEAELEEIFAQAGGAANGATPDAPAPAAKAPRIPDGTSGAETVARGFLPRSFKAEEEGAGVLRKAGAGAMDALSLPGRLLGSLNANDRISSTAPIGMGGAMIPVQPDAVRGRKDPDRDLAEAMADTEGKSVPQQILRDPALLPAVMTGGAALGLAGRAGLSGLKAATAAGALEGVGSATIHQADNAVQGKDLNLKDAALEVGLSAAMPGAAKVAGAAVKGGVKLGNKLLGRAAEELSGVSEEALRTYGLGMGEGAKKLQAAAGTQHQTGQKLVKMLDNLDDYLPEKDVVDQALQQMPAVNVAGTIQRLQGAKTGGALSSSRATNAKIDDLVSDLTGAADETGNIPAAKFREIRKEIDDLVGDAFGKESNKYVTALKEARHQMADDLATTAEASGKPEYVEAMRSMAQKLRKADDLKSFLGKSAQTREQRAESFISTLFGKNKEERRKAVAAMGEIFGEDFLTESKLANLAAELGDEGRAGLLPRQFTGRAALGPSLAVLSGSFGPLGAALPPLALASPRIAAGTLEATRLAGRGLEETGRGAGRVALSGPGRQVLRSWLTRKEEE
jgi:hypothetical protein